MKFATKQILLIHTYYIIGSSIIVLNPVQRYNSFIKIHNTILTNSYTLLILKLKNTKSTLFRYFECKYDTY